MKHLYVEGIEIEVSAERAAEMVASGSWFVCEHQHSLKDKYTEVHCLTVYHKSNEGPKRRQ